MSANVSAQTNQTPDFSVIKTEKGMMVANHHQTNPFVFLVPGKNPQNRQLDDGGLLIGVDERVTYDTLLRYFFIVS